MTADKMVIAEITRLIGTPFVRVELPNGPAHKLRRYHLSCAKMLNLHRSCQAHNPTASFGLIRQYPPKKQSMACLTQHDCNWIATQLNTRPRNRLGYRTPEACYAR